MTTSRRANIDNQYMLLQKEKISLRVAIREIKERLVCLEASLPKQKVIVLREISKDQATSEIKDLFAKGKTLYYSEVAEKLRLDLQTVVEICNELQQNGEIEIVDNVL
jgi:DNA invertase Pin-like site-specific DNA recombinase